MKILVTAKRVVDPEQKVRLKPDGSDIDTSGATYVVNYFDEIATEEALRLKEKNPGSEVVVFSIGPAEATQQVRQCLAMGADRAIMLKQDGYVCPDTVARTVAKVVEQEKPDLVIMGKQATDDNSGVAGQLTAEYLGWPQATFASKVEVLPGGRTLKVLREVDGGMETIEVDLPAVLTADLRLNEPRYASLPGIMKAKSKPLKEVTFAALGVDPTPRVKPVRYTDLPPRKAGQLVADVPTLIQKLTAEAKVL